MEKLSPDTVLAKAQIRHEVITNLINEKKHSLEKAPSGRIRIDTRGNNLHCYHITDPQHPAGKYIASSGQKLIRSLIQKEYDQKVLNELQHEEYVLSNFIKSYHPETIVNIYDERAGLRQNFIVPVQISNKEYATRWQAQPYKGKPLSDTPEFLTSKGESVRSKSEVIIADTLAQFNVPYKYECPLKMNTPRGGAITVFPDFTCLNVRTQEQFLWEHLGRMEDPKYSVKLVVKTRTFSQNGFILGKNLLITTECNSIPLDRKEVEQLVKAFLL